MSRSLSVWVCVSLCSMTFGIQAGCQTANISSDCLRCTTSLRLHLPLWPSIIRRGCTAQLEGGDVSVSALGHSLPLLLSRLQSIEESPAADGQRDDFQHFPPNCLSVYGSPNGHVALQHPQPFIPRSTTCLFTQIKPEGKKKQLYCITLIEFPTFFGPKVFTVFPSSDSLRLTFIILSENFNTDLMDCLEVWLRHSCPLQDEF